MNPSLKAAQLPPITDILQAKFARIASRGRVLQILETLSHKFAREVNPGMGEEDLAQEGWTMLWLTIKKHPALEDDRTVAFWVRSFHCSLLNMVSSLSAKKRLGSIRAMLSMALMGAEGFGEDNLDSISAEDHGGSAIVAGISSRFQCMGVSAVAEIQSRGTVLRVAVEELIFRLPEFDRLVFLCFWEPTEGIVRRAVTRAKRTGRPPQIAVEDLSRELRIKPAKAREALGRIRCEVRQILAA